MKIKTEKGRHFEKDRIIKIETKGYEALSIRKLTLIINQLAFNESNKYKRALENGGELWFEEASKEAIEMGKKGIDLLDEGNSILLEKFCSKWKLPIQKIKQTTMGDFEI